MNANPELFLSYQQNYLKAFQDENFLNALIFTIKFTVISVVSINILAFFLALALTKGIKGTNLFRTVFFMPNLIGGIVLGYIWQLIINGVLYKFNATLSLDAKYGFWGLIVLMNWQMIGYMMNYICCRYPEHFIGYYRGGQNRWGKQSTDIVQGDDTVSNAIRNDMPFSCADELV